MLGSIFEALCSKIDSLQDVFTGMRERYEFEKENHAKSLEEACCGTQGRSFHDHVNQMKWGERRWVEFLVFWLG